MRDPISKFGLMDSFMRRKKVFIAIVILLVLGIGLFTEYRHRTADIEFEVLDGLYASYVGFDSCYAFSNPFLACVSEGQLAVHDIVNKTRTKISSDPVLSTVLMDYPWVVWEEVISEKYVLSAYDLRQSLAYPISEYRDFLNTKMDGNIVVWDVDNVVMGYDLEKKIQFPISVNANWKDDPDIDGDTVVWRELINLSPPCYAILCHNLKSGTKQTIRTTSLVPCGPRVAVPYIVWKEMAPEEDSILAYDLRNGETITVCSGVVCWSMDIGGDILVLEHRTDGVSSDIYGYNLKTHRPFPICMADNDQRGPKISDNIVIWVDNRPQGWISKLLKKKPSDLRGKIFRHWPGEEK